MEKITIRVKSVKRRNPYVAASLFRKAGEHEPRGGKRRALQRIIWREAGDELGR